VFSFYYLYARYDTNKVAVGAVSDVVRGLLRRCLLLNDVWLHGTRVNVFLFMPIRKVKPSLHRFSRHLEMFSSIISRFLALNFTQARKKRRKCGQKCVPPLPSVECGYQCADFCGTPKKETKYSIYFI